MTLVWEGIGVAPFAGSRRLKAVAGVPDKGELICLGSLAGGELVRVTRVEWHVVHTLFFFNARLEPTVFVAGASTDV